MTLFITLSIALTLLSLVLLTRPLWRRVAPAVADAAGHARQQLQQLEALRASGALDDAAFAQARERIERQLGAAVVAPVATPHKPMPRALVAGLAVFVVVVVAAGYAGIGAPVALDPAAVAAQAPQGGGHSVTMEQIEGMAEKLAARLKEQPDDPEGWAMLGRSYAVLGKHDKAVPAFKQAMTLRPGDAVLIADYADALAVVNGRSLEGEPSQLIEQALKADPNNLKALSLAGTAAFYRRDYALALRHWEKMTTIDPGSPFVQQIQGGIDEARKLMAGGGAAPAPAPAPAAVAAAQAQPPKAAAETPATGASVSGVVSLAPALAAKADPQDTVFVFARATEGPRMPLAILRKQVKDLPIRFTLDDSMAMTPAAKLSSARQVVIGARISKRGDATAQPGDLQGLSAPVAPGASGLKIEISQVVGP